MSAPILRMREAGFVARGEVVAAPTSFEVQAGMRHAHLCATPREAHAVALMAGGLARATQGAVLIGEYDPRVQPVHCKRLAGFVPHDPLVLANFPRYISYRAALWNIDAEAARAQAAQLLERLGSLHEAFAYPVAAALIASPALLVLDRPQFAYADAIAAVTSGCAVFSTHVDAETATAYGPVREVARA